MRALTVNRRFRFLALSLGVVAGLGVAEIGLRLAGEAESEIDRLSGWKFKAICRAPIALPIC